MLVGIIAAVLALFTVAGIAKPVINRVEEKDWGALVFAVVVGFGTFGAMMLVLP